MSDGLRNRLRELRLDGLDSSELDKDTATTVVVKCAAIVVTVAVVLAMKFVFWVGIILVAAYAIKGIAG